MVPSTSSAAYHPVATLENQNPPSFMSPRTKFVLATATTVTGIALAILGITASLPLLTGGGIVLGLLGAAGLIRVYPTTPSNSAAATVTDPAPLTPPPSPTPAEQGNPLPLAGIDAVPLPVPSLPRQAAPSVTPPAEPPQESDPHAAQISSEKVDELAETTELEILTAEVLLMIEQKRLRAVETLVVCGISSPEKRNELTISVVRSFIHSGDYEQACSIKSILQADDETSHQLSRELAEHQHSKGLYDQAISSFRSLPEGSHFGKNDRTPHLFRIAHECIERHLVSPALNALNSIRTKQLLHLTYFEDILVCCYDETSPNGQSRSLVLEGYTDTLLEIHLEKSNPGLYWQLLNLNFSEIMSTSMNKALLSQPDNETYREKLSRYSRLFNGETFWNALKLEVQQNSRPTAKSLSVVIEQHLSNFS